MSTVSSQLLLSCSHQGQSDEEEVTVMQFCISLQSGLLPWAHQLALASTDHRYMYVKPGSQYDAGTVNVEHRERHGKSFFFSPVKLHA